MSSHGNIIKTQLKEFFANEKMKMPGTVIAMRKNLANYSELLENREEYFLILFEEIYDMFIFSNWKINRKEENT